MKIEKTAARLGAVCFWLVVWQLVSYLVNRGSLLVLLPAPTTVLQRLGALVFTRGFWRAVAFSMSRIVGGLLVAMVLGVLLAALSAAFGVIEILLHPLMLVVRSVPVASFIILALILFSSRNLALLISALMVLPILYSNTLGGIRACDRQLLEMAEVYQLPWRRKIRYIYLPQLWPYWRSGCTAAFGLCWKAGVAAEVIGIPKGSIGEFLQQAKVYLQVADLFAWTLVIVLLSLCLEKLGLFALSRLARRLEKI